MQAQASSHASTSSAVPPLAGIPPERRRAIVVGASSGMGAAVCRQLAREGYRVAALARRADQLEALAASVADAPGEILPRAHDVSDTAAVPALFEELVRELGGLDLFVFAAGIMPEVGPTEYDTDVDLKMLAINFGGCVAWTNPVAALFRTQRWGTIIGVSSVAGERGRKGNPMYGSTKAAMNHYLESLRNRLSEVGVHVCTIKPGFVETAMTEGKDVFWLITAEAAASQILAAGRNRVNERFVPLRWGLVMFVIRNIPSFIFRRLNF